MKPHARSGLSHLGNSPTFKDEISGGFGAAVWPNPAFAEALPRSLSGVSRAPEPDVRLHPEGG